MDLAIVIGVIVGIWFVYEQGVKRFHLKQFTKLMTLKYGNHNIGKDCS